MSAFVSTAMAQITHNGTNGNENGNRNGMVSSNQGENQGRQLVCTYKDFTYNKPKPFNGSGGVISLRQCFEKMESYLKSITA